MFHREEAGVGRLTVSLEDAAIATERFVAAARSMMHDPTGAIHGVTTSPPIVFNP
jgi:hypothetical protein